MDGYRRHGLAARFHRYRGRIVEHPSASEDRWGQTSALAPYAEDPRRE